MTPKYPDITVALSGEDGNAFYIIGRVQKAMRKAGVDSSEIKAFCDEAMAGDYDNVLSTTMRTVNVT